MTKISRQTMMIVWKWEGPDHNMVHINEKTWEDSDFTGEEYLQNISKGEGIFYNECDVAPSETCPDACLVRATIYNTGSEVSDGASKNEQLLDRLIEYQLEKREKLSSEEEKLDHKFMLFLHRGNHYHERDVDRLFDKFKGRITNIFLFAHGRNFIYYPVRLRGILNDKGDFFQQRDARGDKVEVYNRDENLVLQPYFDRTWWHYEVEFEHKVFELKEDLFDAWLPFMLPSVQEEIKVDCLTKASRDENKGLLYYRLKSFVNAYEKIKIKEEDNFDKRDALQQEVDHIIKFERKDKRSYLFDDCLVNLKYEINPENDAELVVETYNKAKEQVINLLFNEQRNTVLKAELRTLADTLNYLVKIIPGDMD